MQTSSRNILSSHLHTTLQNFSKFDRTTVLNFSTFRTFFVTLFQSILGKDVEDTLVPKTE